jgi:hypothetical protein
VNIKWPGADERSLALLRAISILFGQNQDLISFLFDPEKPRLRKRAGILRDDAWKFSEEDQLVIRVALDLWSGSGHVHLWELIESWDQPAWSALNAAVLKMTSVNALGSRQIKL